MHFLPLKQANVMQIRTNSHTSYLNAHIPENVVLQGFTIFCLSHVLQDIIKLLLISGCELQSVLLVATTDSLA